MKPFFVYMLRCSDGSLYVGHTDDLERRLAAHGDGTLPGYTCSRRPVMLIWSAEMASRDEALQRELQVKGWTRAKKLALARDDWSGIRRLARGRHRAPTAGAANRGPAPRRARGGIAVRSDEDEGAHG